MYYIYVYICVYIYIYTMNTMCAVSGANHLRAIVDAFHHLRTHQRY